MWIRLYLPRSCHVPLNVMYGAPSITPRPRQPRTLHAHLLVRGLLTRTLLGELSKRSLIPKLFQSQACLTLEFL